MHERFAVRQPLRTPRPQTMNPAREFITGFPSLSGRFGVGITFVITVYMSVLLDRALRHQGALSIVLLPPLLALAIWACLPWKSGVWKVPAHQWLRHRRTQGCSAPGSHRPLTRTWRCRLAACSASLMHQQPIRTSRGQRKSSRPRPRRSTWVTSPMSKP